MKRIGLLLTSLLLTVAIFSGCNRVENNRLPGTYNYVPNGAGIEDQFEQSRSDVSDTLHLRQVDQTRARDENVYQSPTRPNQDARNPYGQPKTRIPGWGDRSPGVQ